MNYDIKILSELSKKYGYVRNTFEKVLRLVEILQYINTSDNLKGKLALKGGTAINLLYDDLPRLSVDIDLDYAINLDKEKMFEDCKKINENLKEYLEIQGYEVSEKSRFFHSLDSHVITYTSCGGGKDNIKIEINYSLRGHLLDYQNLNLNNEIFVKNIDILVLSKIEIYAGKITALLMRSQIRDLYDTYRMVKNKILAEEDIIILKNILLFYLLLSSKNQKIVFNVDIIDKINNSSYVKELLPVLKKNDDFDLNVSKCEVKKFLKILSDFDSNQISFINGVENKKYCFELLFKDENIVNRANKHPMVLWKKQNLLKG